LTLLHITTVPQTLGFMLRQMLYMRQLGWRVHTSASPGRYEATLKGNAIPFHPVNMQRRITPLRDLWAIARLWKIMRHIRPTVVHAHTPKAGLLGMISARLARVPVRVFHVHGLPHLTSRGVRYRLLVLATKVACALAHRVLCVSPSIRQVLVEQDLCPRDKVLVPVNGSSGGVDAEGRFNPASIGELTASAVRARHGVPPGSFVVAFIGRLVRDKGVVELCEAWCALRLRHPELHLLIAGDFEPQDPVPLATIETLRSDPRVHLAGFCENVPEFLAAIDLVVFPSYREGFPNVPLEAAAMGVPVVATAVPGCVDSILDNVTGTLVPPYNSTALAAAIERYMNEPARKQKHGLQARARVLRDFRSEPIWGFISNQYDEQLRRAGLVCPRSLSENSLRLVFSPGF
jgi:glycosyltransferase involved in cell wall biosynthesis